MHTLSAQIDLLAPSSARSLGRVYRETVDRPISIEGIAEEGHVLNSIGILGLALLLILAILLG